MPRLSHIEGSLIRPAFRIGAFHMGNPPHMPYLPFSVLQDKIIGIGTEAPHGFSPRPRRPFHSLYTRTPPYPSRGLPVARHLQKRRREIVH